jgi:hypothetical protein
VRFSGGFNGEFDLLFARSERVGDIKYTITSRLSALLMVKYEDFRDDNEASRENYTATIGGLHMTYLF